MKRKMILIAMIVLALTAAVSLAGCGSEGAAEQGGETAVSEEIVPGMDEDDMAVVGHWQMVKYTLGDEELDISDVQTVYVFNDDGSFEMLLNGDSAGVGNFYAEGTAITFDIGGNETEMQLKNDQLISETETADGVVVTVYQRAEN